MKTYFPIAAEEGRFDIEGFVPHKDSLLAIHRKDSGCPWTVTFLPTGTKCDSVFPERFGLGQREMLARLQVVEDRALAAWLALSSLPWGCQEVPEWGLPMVAAIREAARS